MQKLVKPLFAAVPVAMLTLTFAASLERLWVAWRERTVLARVIWFVLFMGLGSIATSIYVLRALHGRRPLMAGPAA